MRVGIFGFGMVGSYLAHHLERRGYEVYVISRRAQPSPLYHLRRPDYAYLQGVLRSIEDLDGVVNTVALSVDRSERVPDLATEVNAEIAGRIALASSIQGIYMVQLSTDYVFSGRRGRYRPGDRPGPVNVYGATKLMGEGQVLSAHSQALILRTSTIFGCLRPGGPQGFLEQLLLRLRKGLCVNAAVDQQTSPTYIRGLCDGIEAALRSRPSGVYHGAGKEQMSRYSFARAAAEAFGLDEGLVRPVRLASLPFVAKRPRDTTLDSNGSEWWGFRPPSVYRALEDLADTDYMMQVQAAPKG